MKRWFKKERVNENGAVIVEATIALPVFIFAILMILSLVDICYVQSKVSVAINAAAKEMSQYGYLYTTLNLDEHMSGTGGKSSEFMSALGEVLNEVGQETKNVSDEVSSMFSSTGDIASNDSIAEYAKNGLGRALASKLVKKNLVSYKNDTAENFCQRNQIVGGYSGLNFMNTSFLSNEDQNEVDIVVSYEVRVIRFLNVDFSFRFMQRATSRVWGNGVSLITSDGSGGTSSSQTNSSSIWDTDPLSRGKAIIKEEKKNYEYTSDKNGFHAYDEENNEFIRILSVNTNEETYSDPVSGGDSIRYSLNSAFSTLYNGAGWVEENVTVQDSSGKDVIISTPEEGRTYKLVLVIPENADMTIVNAAVREFELEKQSLGYDVEVELKVGYGSPTEQTKQTIETEQSESE